MERVFAPCVPFALLLAVLLGSCGPTPPADEAFAFVGGESIPYARFERYVEEVTGDRAGDLETEVLSALLDDFLVEEQVRRLAIDRGLVDGEASGREALAALLRNGEAAQIEEAALREYYTRHQEELRRPERVRLRQILVDDRLAAERAVAELDAGTPFAEVASRLSIEPSAPFGGDQGELSRDELPEAFADQIFALEPGERSDVVEAAYGYHIFMVEERLPAELVAFEEARPLIRSRLAGELGERRRQGLVEEAQSRYNVRIEPRRLPFTYRSSDGERSTP